MELKILKKVARVATFLFVVSLVVSTFVWLVATEEDYYTFSQEIAGKLIGIPGTFYCISNFILEARKGSIWKS